MVSISKVYSLLMNSKIFASLNSQQQINAMNFAMQEVKKDSIECVNNEVEGSYERFTNMDIPSLSLAITERIDDFLSDDDYLKNFTLESRLLIYNIVQSKIETSDNFSDETPYLVNNMKGDYVLFQTGFTPSLDMDKLIIDSIKMLTVFNPMLYSEAIQIDKTRIYSYFIPALSFLASISNDMNKTFIPQLNLLVSILAKISIDKTFIPSLTAVASYLTSINQTFNPLLVSLAQIKNIFDYEVEYSFIPSLTLSVSASLEVS